MFRRLLAVLLLSLGSIAPAAAWWDAQWAYRKAIDIDTTAAAANIAGTLTDVPVLVRLHTGNFTQFLNSNEGGTDLRFVAEDDKTVLKHHVERFDPVNELAYVWVRIPTVAGAKVNKVWMYFGNGAAPGAGDAPGTRGPADVLVYHFAETTGLPQDSTSNGHHAASFAGQMNPASLIGGGARFAALEPLVINDAPVLRMTAAQGWEFSTWIKLDTQQTDAFLFDRSEGTARLTLGIDGVNAYVRYTGADGATAESPRTTALTTAWHALTLVAANNRLTLYLDGQETAALDVPLADMGGAITIGGAADGTHLLSGDIDELRIANQAPATDAIRFAAVTQGPETKAISYGGDETQDTEGASEGGAEEESASYFGVILNQVFGNKDAVVEQAVIGFCGFMALIAFTVMFLKAVYLSRARATTKKFLAAYHALGIDAAATVEGADGKGLAALYNEDRRFHASPLFRVYKLAVAEMHKRLSPSTAGAQAASGLEEKSIGAIRAAIDATMVREGQRMNAQMVLLTIAISGGPFIGLLGTVVGVMVTFAAIAATGDVNINAIAPGMAAALLATVAGLGVAIPSLFGYNYLGSIVKDVSADMHVFADELVARMVEIHGE